MRRKLTIAVVATVALAAAAVGLASAQSTSSSSKAAATQTIKLFALTVQQAEIDVGTPGFGLGDQFVFSDDLSAQKGSEKIGFDAGVCTIVRLDDHGNTATNQCVATASLHEGQIAIQGLVTFAGEEGPGTFVLPITGGSGAYKNARGQVTVETLSETESNLTFEIIGG